MSPSSWPWSTATRLLGVGNTHVRWDRPGTPADEQVGFRQVIELVEACRRFEPRCDGWLVCGDFNRTPDGEAVDLMRRAGFVFAHQGRPHARSCVANGRASLVDYLFHTTALWSRPQDLPPVSEATWLPSREQPSDHLPLVAEFGWV
jgi:endonuclease/exonuclease/phosphatase (EEP) superfamily protein YafD